MQHHSDKFNMKRIAVLMPLTICVNTPQKVLLQIHSIKSFMHLIIGGKEILSFSCEPALIKLANSTS
jgi:hypothetical protein